MTTLELPERPRILVITLRRLGDVLLTTPLIRTIRRGFPQATLDMLVFRDTEDILRGNPDIDNVVSSLFNSHLFDFGEGWLYVFGVGLTGGMMLRAADAAKAERKT